MRQQPILIFCTAMDLRRSIESRLPRWLRRPWTSEGPAHLALGRMGEDAACDLLKAKNFRILRRNFHSPQGGDEIDIVCRDREVLVFVEVKTRTSEEFGRPVSAVDKKKRRHIIRGAMAWLRMLDMPDIAFRFDVIEVVGGPVKLECNHIENAFNLPEPYRY